MLLLLSHDDVPLVPVLPSHGTETYHGQWAPAVRADKEQCLLGDV